MPGSHTINGWLVLMTPEFTAHYVALRDEARRLKAQLSAEQYRRHPTVKLAASVNRLVMEIVPRNPDRPEFKLHGDLRKFRRAKGRGLPPRYRLFWTFSQRAKCIIFLYLNDDATLRQQGGRNDPYTVFAGMVRRNEIGADFESNYQHWKRARTDNAGQ